MSKVVKAVMVNPSVVTLDEIKAYVSVMAKVEHTVRTEKISRLQAFTVLLNTYFANVYKIDTWELFGFAKDISLASKQVRDTIKVLSQSYVVDGKKHSNFGQVISQCRIYAPAMRLEGEAKTKALAAIQERRKGKGESKWIVDRLRDDLTPLYKAVVRLIQEDDEKKLIEAKVDAKVKAALRKVQTSLNEALANVGVDTATFK